MDINFTGSCSALDGNKSSALHNSHFFFWENARSIHEAVKCVGPKIGLDILVKRVVSLQPKMLGRPSRSVVTIRTVCYPVSESKI